MLPATLFCWPFVSTPAIEGRVFDASTNEPIENTIIDVIWHGMQVAPADRTGVEVAKIFIVTGKDGKFNVPKKSFFQPTGLLSNVDQLRLVVRHPLYETKEIYANYDDKTKTWVNFGELEKGKFHLELKILSLKDKYKDIGGNFVPGSNIHLSITYLAAEMTGASKGDYYFRNAVKLGIDKVWLNNIFNNWNKLAGNYNKEDAQYLIESINKMKVEYRDILNK